MRNLFPLAILALGSLSACGDKDDSDSGTTDTDTDTTDTDTTDTDTTDTDTDTMTGMCSVDVCATYPVSTMQAVAGQIVDAAVADPEFTDDFAVVTDVDAFKASLGNFITDTYGCTTNAYTGPTMEEAHAGMMITTDEYNDFLGIIVGVLQTDGVPQDQIDGCFAPPLTDTDFMNTIVGQ